MDQKKAKWLIYTVIVGLIPIVLRFIFWCLLTNKEWKFIINPADFVLFGMVLHVSVINELEHYEANDKSWKTLQMGTSIVAIMVYSGLLMTTMIAEVNAQILDISAIRAISALFILASIFLGYAVHHRLSQANLGENQ